MSFTYFKRGECPVCSGARKDCRQSNETDLIFCRHHEANPIGYIYRGDDRNGAGMWQASVDAEAFFDEAREKRRLEFLAAEVRRKQQQIDSQLPAVQRDKYYRQILNELSLSESHRQHLLNERQFTPEQIKNDGYKSVQQWQKIVGTVPSNLPGLLRHGSLNAPGDGILCPVRNQDGLIVALKLRLDDGTQGRYRWLTSATKKNRNGATPHYNGELPLSVFEPDEYSDLGIWLTEGLEFKPSMTRMGLNVPVLGSGKWSVSPHTAKSSIDYLSQKYNTKLLTFCPDAGDILNLDGVPQRWLTEIKFFESLGYQCRVAWWEQVTKEQCDIDELNDYSVIQFITPEQFKAQIEHYQAPSKVLEQAKQQSLVDDWAWKQWLRSRNFTPDIVLNQKEFTFPAKLPQSSAIIAIKSGLGTNKTGAMLREIQMNGRGAKITGYRNNLLFQTIARGDDIRLQIYHLREDDGRELLAEISIHQAFCLDSIHQAEGYFQDCDIYLDETCSVLLHAVVGGTLKDNQDQVLRIFSDSLRACNNIYLLDGNLSDVYVNHIAKIAPNKQVVKIENQSKIASHNIKFIETVDAEGEMRKRDKSPLVAFLADDDVIPFIYCDSKRLTNILAEILRGLGKTGYVLNADTVGDEWSKKFLDAPDKFLAETKPQFFIGSPTIESGVSILLKGYFTHKFSFFTGVAATNSQHQGMFRLRDETIDHYVFCPEISSIRDAATPRNYSAKKIQQLLDERITQSAILASQYGDNPETITEIITKAMARQQDEWWEFSCVLGAIDNYERDHLRKCLIHVLESEAGHNVEVLKWSSNELGQKALFRAGEKVDHELAKELFTAIPFESIEQAKQAKNRSKNKETQRRIEATFLLDRLPGIKDESIWDEEFILNCYVKKRDFISQVQHFYLLNNFAIAKKRHEVDWYYQATKEDFFSGRMKGRSHQTLWALQQLNILDFINSEQEWCKDSPEVIKLLTKVRENKELQTALGLEEPPRERINGEERIAFLKFLLAIVGVKLKTSGRKVKDQQVRLIYYLIDRQSLSMPERLAILNCMERKFSQWMQSDKAQVQWDSLASTAATTSPTQDFKEVVESLPDPLEALHEPSTGEILPKHESLYLAAPVTTTITYTDFAVNDFVWVDCPEWDYHASRGVVINIVGNNAIVESDRGQLTVDIYWLKKNPRAVEVGFGSIHFRAYSLIKMIKQGIVLAQSLLGDKGFFEIPAANLIYAMT